MRLFHTLTLLLMLTRPAYAETTVTVAMTAGDIPITTGIPDQGSEGVRFVGYSL
jgi:peptide/nickel transport system substrate-binding protein